MAKPRDIVIGLIIGGSFLAFFLLLFAMFWIGGRYESDSDGLGGFGKKVAIVNLYGVIESSTDIVRQLDRWGRDGSVKAIVLHINSPGGGVAPSQEIYDKILDVKESYGKPIVASMSSVCASGGYYVACAADQVVANPGSLTGSIGVIIQFPVVGTMLEKVGIKFETIKSGGRKDIGSPFREPTDDDSAAFQAIVDDTYDQFVEAVSEQRNMDREEVKLIADGSIYSGRQAQELGLVDSLGTFEDAVDLAGELCGLGKDPDRVREVPRRRVGWLDLLGNLLQIDLTQLVGKDQDGLYPRLQYLFN